MKLFKESREGWYAVVGDGNVVIATSKDLPFEFSILGDWKQMGDMFTAKIKKGV